MRAIDLIVLAGVLVVWSGCPSDDDPFGSPADDDAAGDDDTALPLPPQGGEPLSWSTPVPIAGVEARAVSLQFAPGGAVHATYYEPDPEDAGHGTLYLVRAEGTPPEFGEPVAVTPDAFAASWRYDGAHIDMVATRLTQLVQLSSDDDGASWTDVDTLPTQGGDSCWDKFPAFLGQDEGGALQLVHNYQHPMTAGCWSEIKVSSRVEGQWVETAAFDHATATGLFVLGGDRLVVPTPTVVLTSADGGVTFDEGPVADLTCCYVGGADGVMMSDGAIWLVRSFSWAGQSHVGVVASDPQLTSWTSPHLVLAQSDQVQTGPTIAAAGQMVVVAWLSASAPPGPSGQSIWSGSSRVSRDGGVTWSEPTGWGLDGATIDDYESDGLHALDVTAGRAAVVFKARDTETFEPLGLFFTDAAL